MLLLIIFRWLWFAYYVTHKIMSLGVEANLRRWRERKRQRERAKE